MAGRFVDFYALLDVASDASFDAVRSAVVQQRQACEQRRATGDPADLAAAEDRIRDLDLAELVLLDPEQRADYDEEWWERRNGHTGEDGGDRGDGSDGRDPSQANGTHGAAHRHAEPHGRTEPPADDSIAYPVADPADATHQPPTPPEWEGPATGTPADHRVAPADTPAAWQPPADTPAAGQPPTDAPPGAGQPPGPGQPPPADAPAAHQPGAWQSTDAAPAGQPPADTHQPGPGQPPADAPAAHQPGAWQSSEAPAGGRPSVDGPVAFLQAVPAPAAGQSAEAPAGQQPPDTQEPAGWQPPPDAQEPAGGQQAAHAAPQPVPEVVEDEDGWIAQAREAVRAGDTALAVDSYHYAIMLHPHQIVLHYELGQAYVHADNYEQALGAFETACRLAPRVTDFRAAVGNALVHLARPGEAIAVLEQVVAEAPTEPRYRADLAQALHDTCVHEMTPLTNGMVCITTAEQAQVVERLTGRALTLLDPSDQGQLAQDIREKHELAKLAGKRVWRPPLPWWLMISFSAVITLGFALFLVWWAAPIALVVLGGVAFLLGLQPTYWHVAREARDADLLA